MVRGFTIAGIIISSLAGLTIEGQDIALSPLVPRINCDEVGTQFCLDRAGGKNYEGKYIGHDEPSVLFLSDTPGDLSLNPCQNFGRDE